MQIMRNFGHQAVRCAALALMVSVLSSQSALAQGRPEIVWTRGTLITALISPNANLTLGSPGVYTPNSRSRWFLSRLWDGKFIRTVRWDRSQGTLTSDPVFTPDGALLAAAGYTVSQGNTTYWIKFWRVSDDSIVRTIPINGQASRIIFSPRGDLVAAVMSNSATVTVWRVSDGSLQRVLQPSSSRFDMQVQFSPDGRLIGIQAGTTEGFRCWRVSDWTELYTIPQHPRAISDFAFSTDGSWLAFAYFVGNEVTVRNALTGSETLTINLSGQVFRPQVLFLPDNRLMIASAYLNYTASIWRIPEGTFVNEYPIPSGRVFVLNQFWGMSLGRIWRLSDGTLVRSIPGSSGGTYVAAIEGDPSQILIWFLRSSAGSLVSVADGLSTRVLSLNAAQVAISPGGTLVAGSEYYAQEPVTVNVHDVDTGELLYTVDTYSGSQRVEYGEVTGLSFSRDGTLLAICGFNLICTNYDYYNNYCNESRLEDFAFWVNASNGSRVGSIQAAVKPTFLKFAPNNTIAASDGPNHTIRIWGIPSGNLLRTLSGHTGRVNELIFSPSGAIMASASEDRTIRLWSTSNWSQIRTLNGHTDSVKALAFSPDGSLLASVGRDNTIRIWRVSDGMLLRTYTEECDDVTSIVWINDLIIFAREDGAIIAARERVGRRERLPVITR